MKKTDVILNWYMRNAKSIKSAVEKEREDCARTVIDIANQDAANPYKQALRLGAYAILERSDK